MAKKELKWMPLLGQFMTLSGAVFIDRKNNTRAFESLAAAGDTIKRRGIALWVFPEGTRTNKPEVDLKPFKKGAFHLAVQAGVPITPVVCQNYWHLYHKGVFESGKLKIKGKSIPTSCPFISPHPIVYVLLCRVPLDSSSTNPNYWSHQGRCHATCRGRT